MTVRVLAVTARKRYPKVWLQNLHRGLALGDDVQVKVLAAVQPRRQWDVEVTSLPIEAPPAPARGVRRVLDRLRRADAAVPDETSPSERLARACRNDDAPADLARWAEVVVAMDDAGCLAVWELARRIEGPAYVNRTSRVRAALEERGRQLPPPARVAIEPLTQDVTMPALPESPVRLLIAPANYAGQGHQWAQAASRHVPGVAAQNFREGRLANPYPSDLTVDRARFRGDLAWREYWRTHVTSVYTHVIVEAGLPVLGASVMPFQQQVTQLREAGLHVALLSHGSDSRIPSVHAANERWAQFDAMDPAWVNVLESLSRRNVEVYTSDPGPVFLSTPGLLEFVPNGTWLPLVIDVDRWRSDEAVLERGRPVVAHAPSTKQKGSHHIDPVLTELDEQGLIEYRRVEGVPIDEMPRVYGTADIVVDQFGAADYGVAACEALAAGRVVVSHVAPKVRDHIRRETGLDLPIVQADPETLRDVIVRLVHDRAEGRTASASGPSFVETVHDGRLAADVLAHWFAETTSPPVPRSGPDHHTK